MQRTKANDFWSRPLRAISDIFSSTLFELLFSGSDVYTDMEVVFRVPQVVGDPEERDVHVQFDALPNNRLN